jgi:uncharacterized protein
VLTLSWVVLGAVVGALLGLTGAGGSVIALPLLQYLTGMSVHAASVAVLPIVGIAAVVSLLPRFRDVRLGLAALILGVSVPATYATAMLKPFVPDYVMTGFILFFIVWALVQTWRGSHTETSGTMSPLKTGVIVGAIAGLLTTLTGLGGGIVLTPLLGRLTSLKTSEATATAIAVIAGNAFLSFFVQKSAHLPFTGMSFLGLLLGLLVANGLVMTLMKVCPKVCSQRLRTGVYIVVLVIAAGLLVV